MTLKENVLCITTAELQNLGDFNGFTANAARYLPVIYTPGAAFLVDRETAEINAHLKQLIPYTVFFYNEGGVDYILSYTRKGGEKKLEGFNSIGIGGHINQDDFIYNETINTVITNIEREVREEIGYHIDEDRLHVIGLLNDQATPVGLHHLGIVSFYKLTLAEANALTFEDSSMIDPAFRSYETLAGEPIKNFESWSQILLKHIRNFGLIQA